jgi:hypothetical protein
MFSEGYECFILNTHNCIAKYLVEDMTITSAELCINNSLLPHALLTIAGQRTAMKRAT